MGKSKLGNKFITVQVMRPDIRRGECANRRKCVIAQAINRQFGLGGLGYIRVDANKWSMTVDDKRYQYAPPATGMRYLRTFDKIGEKKGLEAARESMLPAAFTCELIRILPVAPPATKARKDRINELRRERDAERRARGESAERQLRYVGV